LSFTVSETNDSKQTVILLITRAIPECINTLGTIVLHVSDTLSSEFPLLQYQQHVRDGWAVASWPGAMPAK
jgi:hypothetical protein